ncbi:MAG TPA: hypothetical protein VFV52_09930, partial [Bacilli bacterium]|nr:hypothetical protein [Bacilli bacterium]
MAQDKYARHGGVHFKQNATNQEINSFVNQLPSDKRDNLFEVLGELDSAGLIALQNDGQFADAWGRLHGTEGCYQEEDDQGVYRG